jgi:eukaryotic-like serine/threonine-protein kinase
MDSPVTVTTTPVVIGGRFEIEREAGSGAMGVVYRALDRDRGRPVALKLLRGGLGAENAVRFAREAELLASLQHPAIVGYVGHGLTKDGERYLALEWIEGETLAARLSRGPLEIAEAVTLVARVADGLGAAHRRELVHRDVKPTNILLAGGAVDRATLLDFGIARAQSATESLTRTGVMVGTPGYMAPEQARGEPGIDARADVFSLGCVLFKCLTGRSAFEGEDVVSVLLKVVLEEAPRVTDFRPEVPAILDNLVADMLAKVTAARPRDGGAVAARLRECEVGTALATPRGGPPALTGIERRVTCVVLARRAAAPSAPDETLAEAPPPIEPGLRARLEPMGGGLRELADGSVLMTFDSRGSATEHASIAARAALLLRRELAGARVAVVAGMSATSADVPMGEVIDRAARYLRDTGGDIRIDEVVASLLEGRYETAGSGAVLRLVGEGSAFWAGGAARATPLVGRDRELRMLEELLEECFGEPGARAVVLTAPHGAGKSRLADELVRRARDRGAEVWTARGDPLSAGSPFGMLGEMLRRTAGILDGEPLDVRRAKLRARLSRCVSPERLERITAFLGDLAARLLPTARAWSSPPRGGISSSWAIRSAPRGRTSSTPRPARARSCCCSRTPTGGTCRR